VVALLSRIFRGRAEGITPEATSLPIPHGVSGPPGNGTRDGASVSPFVVASTAALALVTAIGVHQVSGGSNDGRGEATHRAGERTREGPTMLSATRGMLAMLTVVSGVAG